ncbi:ABC transporter permease [Deinococcus planocerae]|uniref:ABC transporter permease n=1 Tax=Deinococcus planocerae TaxID=1737569 RepID=UPI000C7EC670|nr:ABC transporter permease [Deinococcus planocerae]
MNVLENIRTALTAIGANKLRSLLTMLGVIIGVYAVSTMLALGQMATGAVTQQLNDIGGSQVFVSPRFDPGGAVPPDFSEDDVLALGGLPVQNVSTVSSSVQASTSRRAGSLSLESVPATYPQQLGNLRLRSGRFFSSEEERASAPVIVLSENTASKFFGPLDPLGRTLRVNQSTGPQAGGAGSPGTRREDLTVIGVVASQGGLLGGLAQDSGYVPLSYAWRYFYARDRYPFLLFRVDAGADQRRVQADMTRILAARRGGEDFEIQNFDRFVDQFRQITGVLQLALAGIGGLSLLVGGIGIMNIMLVSVTERTREIGLRKALGARRGTILGQFLIEAVTLTGLGGVIGYGLSVLTVLLVTLAAPSFFPEMVLSPGAAALALGVSALIGLVFGVWPASRAARLTPIEALRHE